MELSWGKLRKKSANRSRTSSSWPIVLSCTDADKETPPMPTFPVAKEDYISQRVYDLPIPSQKAYPDYYERDDDDDDD